MVADIFQDFETYFATKGVLDIPFFYDTFLDSPDFAAALFEYQGQSAPPKVEGVSRSLQLNVRDKNSVLARNKIQEMYNLLEAEGSIIYVTPERWGQITLRQPPFKMRIDEKGRTYYCFNFGLITYHD